MRVWLLLLLCGTAVAAHAEQFIGKVVVVIDGDTVMVTRKGGPPVKVRLAEIDAPEKLQPGGVDSKKSLAELILRKPVTVNSRAVDTYGRLVAQLEVDGMNVNEEQVRRGMAWSYSYYQSNKNLIALQSEAQQAKRGLWAGEEIMKPAQWRKLHATEAPAKPRHEKLRHAKSSRETKDFTCGSKRLCSQMRTCDEAYYYLVKCGVKSLDPSSSGVPCKLLCVPLVN